MPALNSHSADGVRQIHYPSPTKIKRLRRVAGFRTHQEIASMLGVTYRAVKHYEDGTRRMRDIVIVYRFAAAVGVGVDELLNGLD